MRKILSSISSVIFVSSILAFSLVVFISKAERGTGDTLATGVIDLRIGNESYYTDNNGKLVMSQGTSWNPSSLTDELFFNFSDLKPGDIGEDIISIHVNNNNAWICMRANIVSTPENGVNEPESSVDLTVLPNQGELQDHLYFIFWADDGDNVYEKNEKIFKRGLAKDLFNGKFWTLADSKKNIWSGSSGYKYEKGVWKYDNTCKDGEPIIGKSIKHIGKAWCFGEIKENPLNQDGEGKTGKNGPLQRGTGFICDGKDVGNAVQSDGMILDVEFKALQSKNNGNFVCGEDVYKNQNPKKPKFPNYWPFKKNY